MVPSRGRRRRCRFCGELFSPDPRLKGKHYACSAPECQSKRRKTNQTRWLARHPGYFSGRYLKTRAWLEAHPGYLKRYRLAHPEAVRLDNDRRRKRHLQAKTARADMQVAKSLQAVLTRKLTPFFAESRPMAPIRRWILGGSGPDRGLLATSRLRFSGRCERQVLTCRRRRWWCGSGSRSLGGSSGQG